MRDPSGHEVPDPSSTSAYDPPDGDSNYFRYDCACRHGIKDHFYDEGVDAHMACQVEGCLCGEFCEAVWEEDTFEPNYDQEDE